MMCPQDEAGEGGAGAEPALYQNLQASDGPTPAQCAHNCGRIQRRRYASRGE